jgi:hypothetical protein
MRVKVVSKRSGGAAGRAEDSLCKEVAVGVVHIRSYVV